MINSFYNFLEKAIKENSKWFVLPVSISRNNVRDVDRLSFTNSSSSDLSTLRYTFIRWTMIEIFLHEMVIYRLIKQFLDKFIEILIKINLANLIDRMFPRIG